MVIPKLMPLWDASSAGHQTQVSTQWERYHWQELEYHLLSLHECSVEVGAEMSYIRLDRWISDSALWGRLKSRTHPLLHASISKGRWRNIWRCNLPPEGGRLHGLLHSSTSKSRSRKIWTWNLPPEGLKFHRPLFIEFPYWNKVLFQFPQSTSL